MGALLLKIQRAGKALSATTPMHPVERHKENHARTRLSIHALGMSALDRPCSRDRSAIAPRMTALGAFVLVADQRRGSSASDVVRPICDFGVSLGLPEPHLVDIEPTEAAGPIGVEVQQRTVARRRWHRILEGGVEGAPNIDQIAGLVSANTCHRIQAPYIAGSVAAREPESPIYPCSASKCPSPNSVLISMVRGWLHTPVARSNSLTLKSRLARSPELA